MDKHLHIISLDIPYPVRHGGIVDMYFKLKALHKKGIRIHLHCFTKGTGDQAEPELGKYCETIHYYPRQSGVKGFSFRIPYIVSSRYNAALLNRLAKDEYPILAEGIHSTALLLDKRFSNRKIILRLHNVEYKYYRKLFESSASLFKKAYYLYESRILKKYESARAGEFAHILAVSEQDVASYRHEFHALNISYLPVFTGFTKVSSQEGAGGYCLYHGNLSVAENEKAAIWLLNSVFNKLKIPFIIAGKDPSPRLLRAASRWPHVSVKGNLSDAAMQDMIGNAQLNILPSFNNTGIKLKLLNALFNGRHCIVNEAAVAGSGLDTACHIAGNADGFRSVILQLYNLPFGDEELFLRRRLLEKNFDNELNAQRLIQWIW